MSFRNSVTMTESMELLVSHSHMRLIVSTTGNLVNMAFMSKDTRIVIGGGGLILYKTLAKSVLSDTEKYAS